jgi:hypothetical protein
MQRNNSESMPTRGIGLMVNKKPNKVGVQELGSD